MKTFKTLFTSALLSFILLMNTAYSEDRLDGIFFEDSITMLDSLSERLDEIKEQKAELSKIENSLRKTKKGQSIYLKFESIAGSLIAIGIIIGSYKAYFPPGFRAMAGAYVTVTGISHGLIKLTSADVQKLLFDIVKLNGVLNKNAIAVKKQVMFYCDQSNDYHPACY